MIATPNVSITEDVEHFYFPEKVFGVLRASLAAKGYRYTATLTFPKTSSGVTEIGSLVFNQAQYSSITNINCTIICKFVDEDGEDQEEALELKIPAIVADLLAECPGATGGLKSNPRCESKESEFKTKTTLYYSTCTGEILDTVRQDIGGSECLDD